MSARSTAGPCASSVELIAYFKHLGLLLSDFGQLLLAAGIVFDASAELGVSPCGRCQVGADRADVLLDPVGGKRDNPAGGDELPEDVDMVGGVVSKSLGCVEVVRVAQRLCGCTLLGKGRTREGRPA